MRIAIISFTLPILTLLSSCTTQRTNPTKFNQDRAYEDIAFQMSLGPRPVGSVAHGETIDYIQEELKDNEWDTTIQKMDFMGIQVNNIIGKRGQGNPWIILGAHYDTRLYADRDPDPTKRGEPVPGANDGASGVAVLLELARILPQDINKEIWICFFDAEDNGNLAGYDWILGSRAFVSSLEEYPDVAIIVDMVGDTDLSLYLERNSSQELANDIWDVAINLGYEQFKKELKHSILDDHTPFLQAGITAVDIIDFDYPYWHTTDDTLEKVSPASLQAVGETLYTWLVR